MRIFAQPFAPADRLRLPLSGHVGLLMRDPKRIDEMLKELREVWMANPDLRLGQLVVNVVRPREVALEVFNIEDDEFRTRLAALHKAGE